MTKTLSSVRLSGFINLLKFAILFQIFFIRREEKRRGIALIPILIEVVNIMIKILKAKDPQTLNHQKRVANLCMRIAKEMGFPDEKAKVLFLSGLIHDIGKLVVPSEILAKPGKLTKEEFETIKIHPEVGYKILKGLKFPLTIAEIVYQHHERLNGSGYPRGLKNEEILFEARILAVADVVEAMSTPRPYREALKIDIVIEEEILKNSGILYDPEVVKVCFDLYKGKKLENFLERELSEEEILNLLQ